jgi:hypothetical protein
LSSKFALLKIGGHAESCPKFFLNLPSSEPKENSYHPVLCGVPWYVFYQFVSSRTSPHNQKVVKALLKIIVSLRTNIVSASFSNVNIVWYSF